MKPILIITGVLGLTLAGVALIPPVYHPGVARSRTAFLQTSAFADEAPGDPLPPDAWKIPFDVNNTKAATQDDYYDFGWKSFIALNWPARESQRGAPDPTKPIGAMGEGDTYLPVVWETYKQQSEVMLADGSRPPDWNSPAPPLPAPCRGAPGTLMLSALTKAPAGLLNDLQQAAFPLAKKLRGPLIDQNRNYMRYQVTLNQSEFTYLNDKRYYDGDVQVRDVFTKGPDGKITFQTPPKGPEDYVQKLPEYARQGAVETKASWRILDPKKDIFSRYYHRQAYLMNPDKTCSGPYTVGLVGLHILRLTPTTGSTWFWATFEQVDNVKIEDTHPPLRPDGSRLTPSFNPNGPPAPKQFPGGYSYEPAPIVDGQPLPPNPRPVDVWQAIHVAPEVEVKNSKYRAMLSNSIWRFYKMVGVQNVFSPGSPGKPKVWVPMTQNLPEGKVFVNTGEMSNTTMETFLQANACITCHGYGRPLGVAPNDKNNLGETQIFTFVLRAARSATPLNTISLDAPSVVGGNPVNGVVRLASPALADTPVRISFTSDSGSASVSPNVVTIPPGGSSANFTVTTAKVTSESSAKITASQLNVSRPALLTIKP